MKKVYKVSDVSENVRLIFTTVMRCVTTASSLQEAHRARYMPSVLLTVRRSDCLSKVDASVKVLILRDKWIDVGKAFPMLILTDCVELLDTHGMILALAIYVPYF